MAYAELAGLPAITGLYTTVVCLIAYAAFGPSPSLVLGPDSSLGPMIAAVILPLAGGDPTYAVALAGMMALMVGAISVGAGIARLGFISDLLSKPVRLGYMAGLAITIFVGQLPKLFGYSVEGGNVFQDMVAFLQNLDQTNFWALGVGLLSLLIIFGNSGSRYCRHCRFVHLRPGGKRRRRRWVIASRLPAAILSFC